MNKLILLIIATAVISGCLPRSGPSKQHLLAGSQQKGGDALVVEVTNDVVKATKFNERLEFPPNFLNAPALDPDLIYEGDRLLLTIYENIENSLFSPTMGPSLINNLHVDQTGHIFIPYIGKIKAAGHTVEDLRSKIQEDFSEQTPDPQVQLARSEGKGASVIIVGSETQGIYPIDSTSIRLSGMLANAGGTRGTPEMTIINLQRKKQKGKIWLSDLLKKPENDIAMRPGDRLTLETDPRFYSIFGEIGTGLYKFSKPEMSLFDVITSSGGINSTSGDPRSVFVLRNEVPSIAAKFYKKAPKTNKIMYAFNLLQPNALFMARDFQIRGDDLIYVSEAPYSQYTKLVRDIINPINTADTIRDRYFAN